MLHSFIRSRVRICTSAPLLATISACQPPPILLDTGAVPDTSPSIQILYPEPDATILLEEDCSLNVPIVVYVENFELVDVVDGAAPIEGQGHWHGGPSLEEGYCASAVALCEGGGSDIDRSRYQAYALTAGPLTLFASLHDNVHVPIGVTDRVDIELVAPENPCSDTEN